MALALVLVLASAGGPMIKGAGAAQSASASASEPQALLAQAEEAFAERYRQERLEEAIALYEAVLPQLDELAVQDQAFVLDRLSQLYYERTTFSEGDTDEDRQDFRRGRDYGLQSLALDPQFQSLKERDFPAAVRKVDDPAALLWTANNWGKLLGYEGLAGAAQVPKVRSLYRRCLEVDETYWGGSCHNAIGALLASLPAFLGGDLKQAQEHLERAVELAPDYLENHVVLAQYLGFTLDLLGRINGVRDRALIERELRFVLEAPIGDWPFWNRQAKKEAESLLAKLEELSPP